MSRVTVTVQLGPYEKRYRFLRSAGYQKIRSALLFIGEQAKNYMRRYMIEKGCYSPRPRGKHLADTIRVKIRGYRVSVYPTKPYARLVDTGFRPSPGAYNPFDCLKPWKTNKKVYEITEKVGDIEIKRKVVGEFKLKPIKGKRKKHRLIELQRRPVSAQLYFRRPEAYGKGRRLTKKQVKGTHPGFKGYHFSCATWYWMWRNSRRLFVNRLKALGVWK